MFFFLGVSFFRYVVAFVKISANFSYIFLAISHITSNKKILVYLGEKKSFENCQIFLYTVE